MMARLINENDIYALFEKNGTARLHIGDIDVLPRVDAVEVTRCQDCKFYEAHGNRPGGYCWHWEYEEGMSPNVVEDDDFCSNGERRDKDAVD